ncbi:hypothetical protein [Deinococcus seoulensis]|uniref:hypothetical protein n=1 Tax=Deinococcus seoulensis TaxID=1837379 RepID=UPI00166D7EF8|nr:hypothetical protein [Deinococcus seoulensis]
MFLVDGQSSDLSDSLIPAESTAELLPLGIYFLREKPVGWTLVIPKKSIALAIFVNTFQSIEKPLPSILNNTGITRFPKSQPPNHAIPLVFLPLGANKKPRPAIKMFSTTPSTLRDGCMVQNTTYLVDTISWFDWLNRAVSEL